MNIFNDQLKEINELLFQKEKLDLKNSTEIKNVKDSIISVLHLLYKSAVQTFGSKRSYTIRLETYLIKISRRSWSDYGSPYKVHVKIKTKKTLLVKGKFLAGDWDELLDKSTYGDYIKVDNVFIENFVSGDLVHYINLISELKKYLNESIIQTKKLEYKSIVNDFNTALKEMT